MRLSPPRVSGRHPGMTVRRRAKRRAATGDAARAAASPVLLPVNAYHNVSGNIRQIFFGPKMLFPALFRKKGPVLSSNDLQRPVMVGVTTRL